VADHKKKRNSAIQRVALVLTCAIASTLWAPPRAANAQDAFSCIEELTDDEVRYRIRYIENKMQDGKKQATRWRYVWMSLWAAGGAGMTYAAVQAARDGNAADKFGWAYLAGGAYFLAATHAFIPAPDVWGAKRIRRKDDSTEEARRAKLLYATQTLKKSAGIEEFQAGPMGVVGMLTYGVVGGTVKATQWTGQSRGLTAGIYVAPPLLAGIQTATAPKGSLKAYEAYRGIACSSQYYQTTEEGPDLDFSVSPAGGSFTVSF
jgi:hypothetical protein